MMRIFLRTMAMTTLFTVMLSAGVSDANAADGITSHVPLAISQIGDETLGMALGMYSPNYDTLSHQEKVVAYTNIYKALYNGSLPPLTDDDQALLNTATYTRTYSYPSYSGTTPTHRYEPWWDPMWNPRLESRAVMRNFYESGLPHSGWHWSLP